LCSRRSASNSEKIMEKFYAVTLVMNAIIVINFCLGIGAWFSNEINLAGYSEIATNPALAITFNQTDFDNLSDALGTNFGVGAGTGILNTAKTVLWAIPTTAANLMELAGIPVSLKELILLALNSFLGFAYIIFGFEIWSYIRGYGGG